MMKRWRNRNRQRVRHIKKKLSQPKPRTKKAPQRRQVRATRSPRNFSMSCTGPYEPSIIGRNQLDGTMLMDRSVSSGNGEGAETVNEYFSISRHNCLKRFGFVTIRF